MPPRRLTYRQIADDIADRISRGEYAYGQQLPSYRELAALYSVSATTIEKAIGLLRDRRVVVGVPGLGVFALKVPE